MRKGSGNIRKFIWLLLLIATIEAGARPDPSTCKPRVMSLYSEPGVRRLTDDLHKLSRAEFRTQFQLSPANLSILPVGTDLSVLVDVGCLVDSTSRKAERLPWLVKLGQKLRSNQLASSGRGLRSFSWKLESEWDFESLQRRLDIEPCVRIASPNATYHMLASFNDPLGAQQRHLQHVGFYEALDKFYLPLLVRKKVTVAVVDSGVDLTHQDLHLNRWINANEIAGNGIDDDQNGYIDDISGYNFASDIGDSGPQGTLPEANHGTHVAGLAAARIDNSIGGMGINGVARIMSLNIFGPTSTTSSVLLENAIRYAANQGADVINLSLGGREYSRTMREALQYAVSKGSFIVSASGNFGYEICDDPDQLTFVSPASYARAIEGMVAVGSIDVSTNRMSLFSNFSNRLVEIAAPGAISSEVKVGLLSSMPGNRYAELAGTSMSAPLVSGAAALTIQWLKTYGYDASPQKVERIILDSARIDESLTGYIQNGRTLDLKRLADHLSTHFRGFTQGSAE